MRLDQQHRALIVCCLFCTHMLAAGLSEAQLTDARSLILTAAQKTEGLFEGGPVPSRREVTFDKLRDAMTDRHAGELGRLLEACETQHQRNVLFYAFQSQKPAVYIIVLEKASELFSAKKITLDEMFALCFPYGPLLGFLPCNYRNGRVQKLVNMLRHSIEDRPNDVLAKESFLEALKLIEDGTMREAFLHHRQSERNPFGLPVLP